MSDQPKQQNPSEGGCYVRDPVTGELTRVQEPAQEPAQEDQTGAQPVPQDQGSSPAPEGQE